MRLLVTNTRTGQAYAIIRSLRPHAEWISAEMYGSNRFTALTSTAALSRLVDRRVVVPSPEIDWSAGIIQRENTDRDEAYVQAIEAICRRDRIDTIFPSYDPQVYILAKNRERLGRLGVRVLAPEYDTLLTLLDKSRTLKLAEQAGFPHPRTFRVDEHSLEHIAREIEPPWVIRPTVSSRSRGMEVVSEPEQLAPTVRRLQEGHRDLIVQEYIPGTLKQNFYMTIGRDHQVLSVIAPKVLRTSHRVYRNSSAAVLFRHEHEYLERVKNLVSRLGWHGGLTVQTKIDSRDGSLKLMEINPRLGSHTWYSTEMGIDLPLMCYRSYIGEDVAPVRDYPPEALMLEPFEDFFGLFFSVLDRAAYRVRSLIGRRTTDDSAAPASIPSVLGTLRRDYFGPHEKAYMPQFRYGLSDPMVFLAKSWAVLRFEINQWRRIGI